MSVKDTKGQFKNVKQFMEHNGATCNNWRNAWSWVNEKDKIVIFGLWKSHKDGSIFGTHWRKKKECREREHITLVEEKGYILKTFPQEHDEENPRKSGRAVRKYFTSELTEKNLKRKVKNDEIVWYVDGLGESEPNQPIQGENSKPRRRPSLSKPTKDQIRKSSERNSVVKQRHNELQNKLFHYLKSIRGYDKVTMEENYIDVKVEEKTQTILYEVKIGKPISCIRQGLGQVLSYGWLHSKEKNKAIKLVVVGPDAPTEEEKEFIGFIKKNLRIDFEYQQCP